MWIHNLKPAIRNPKWKNEAPCRDILDRAKQTSVEERKLRVKRAWLVTG